MISAKEARQMANQSWVNTFINPIEECIKENIESCFIFFNVSTQECQEIVDYLKEYEYTVSAIGCDPDEYTTQLKISW